MKYCTNCGSEITENAKFCNKCGRKISNTSITVDEPVIEQAITEDSTTNETNINQEIIEEIIANEPKTKETIIEESNDTENEIKQETVEELPVCNSNTLLDLTKDTFIEESTAIVVDEPTTTPAEDMPIKKVSSKKPLFIGVTIALIVTGICAFLFFSKDNLLYDHYYNSATEATSTSTKLIDYNKALKYNYSDTIINDLFNLLKSDPYFEDEINSMSNLNKVDKSKLITKIALLNADKLFEAKNYKSALNSLNVAAKYGYDINSYSNYKAIEKGLKETPATDSNLDPLYSFKNNNPSANTKDIYKYSEDFIIPNSDMNYLTAAELSGYNKEALALIRNEIFARHGYVFETEPFKSYFNSKSWYTPNPSFKGDESKLNEYERANVHLILNLEKGN